MFRIMFMVHFRRHKSSNFLTNKINLVLKRTVFVVEVSFSVVFLSNRQNRTVYGPDVSVHTRHPWL